MIVGTQLHHASACNTELSYWPTQLLKIREYDGKNDRTMASYSITALSFQQMNVSVKQSHLDRNCTF